jgi:hypothetical protein
MPRDIGTERRVPIGRADRYIDAVSVFWLNYRRPDGRAAGVVVVESAALIQARMKGRSRRARSGTQFHYWPRALRAERSAHHIRHDRPVAR